jgi:hypothetical protein
MVDRSDIVRIDGTDGNRADRTRGNEKTRKQSNRFEFGVIAEFGLLHSRFLSEARDAYGRHGQTREPAKGGMEKCSACARRNTRKMAAVFHLSFNVMRH